MSILSAHILDEIRELPTKYPQPRSAVMPALDLAQEELGYLTPEAMTEVASALELDAGYVEGVATFYSLFHLAPVGKHHFYVCTNLSCALRGAGEIVDHLKTSIGVSAPDEVSKDGMFSYEEVECLGACEFAPMMRFDHRFHYDLTPDKIDTLISATKGSVPSPPRGEGQGERLKPVRPRGAEAVPSPPRGEGQGEGLKQPSTPQKPRAPRKKKAADA
jgi:NADH-quinone oxidoreductase subunit E